VHKPSTDETQQTNLRDWYMIKKLLFFFVIDDQNTNNSNNLFMNLLNLDALQKKDYYNSPIINIFHNIMITTERTRLS
jgi:hypothetical protein